jgi:hypothetical protein
MTDAVDMVRRCRDQMRAYRRARNAERKRRIREAKALGVQAITIDGARYELGEAVKAPEQSGTELDEWIEKHARAS